MSVKNKAKDRGHNGRIRRKYTSRHKWGGSLQQVAFVVGDVVHDSSPPKGRGASVPPALSGSG